MTLAPATVPEFPRRHLRPVGWREHQGAAVASGVEHGGRGDADGRLAAAHLAVDDRGAFATIEEQFGGGAGPHQPAREQLALEAREDDLSLRPRLAGVNRRIGAVERIEQLVAELGYEVLQAEREGEATASSRSPCAVSERFQDRGTW